MRSFIVYSLIFLSGKKFLIAETILTDTYFLIKCIKTKFNVIQKIFFVFTFYLKIKGESWNLSLPLFASFGLLYLHFIQFLN